MLSHWQLQRSTKRYGTCLSSPMERHILLNESQGCSPHHDQIVAGVLDGNKICEHSVTKIVMKQNIEKFRSFAKRFRSHWAACIFKY